jgi:hypothetical protein
MTRRKVEMTPNVKALVADLMEAVIEIEAEGERFGQFLLIISSFIGNAQHGLIADGRGIVWDVVANAMRPDIEVESEATYESS